MYSPPGLNLRETFFGVAAVAKCVISAMIGLQPALTL